MGSTRELFAEVNQKIADKEIEMREYFQLLDEEEYENYMRNKYGYSLGATMMIASGETSMDLTFKDI